MTDNEEPEEQLEPTGFSHKACNHESTRAARAMCRVDRESLPTEIGKLFRTRELLRQKAVALEVDSEVTQLDYSNVDLPRLTQDVMRLRKALEPAEKAMREREHQEKGAAQEQAADREHQFYLRTEALERAAQWTSGEGWVGTAVHVVAAAQVFEHYLSTGEQMDEEQAVGIFVQATATSDAIRRAPAGNA